jgi:S-adenosyl-L-methionine hydrolase (adenosine-forming)
MRVITLLTDFGTRDSYVGEIRGRLLTLAPDAVLADITHEIAPGDVPAGAYVLERSWRAFPAGTIHLAVVDPGVGSERRGLALRAGGHSFVGPDNGLFTGVADRLEAVVDLPVPVGAAATFHGRDVFAPAAAALAVGVPLDALGIPLQGDLVRLGRPQPMSDGASLIGEVVYIDRFGTLVTNLAEGASGPIEVAGTAVPLRRTFSDVASGELVAMKGSGGTIEIALRDGSAAEQLGVGVGCRVRTRRVPDAV